MKIKSVEFKGALAQRGGWRPPPLPQVAFSGRSNVGKSSLINRFLGRTRSPIARVSATPGKTQEINFYDVRAEVAGAPDHHFYLVDLPGYGYARAPGQLRTAWKSLMESYLGDTPELRGVVQLIDVRHDPTPDDLKMVSYLAGVGLPTLFVLTKVDKLRNSERDAKIKRSLAVLGADEDQVVPFSSVTGEGRDELLQSVEALLATEEEE